MPRLRTALMRRLAGCSAAVVLAVPYTALAAPAVKVVPEYKLKAAFVYNFALFTDWPAEMLASGGTFNICANPDSAVLPELSGLGDKQVKGRQVVVRKVTELDSMRTCHVLFLDSLDRARWGQIRKNLANASVLTVSDDSEISRDGAIIGLYLENNRIGFSVDLQAARQARLVVSSRLLRLARSVQ